MDNILITPETCMQFLIWSYYYHDIIPEKQKSYGTYGKFADNDVERLDSIKNSVFQCFEEESVRNACKQFQLAKERHEPCPYPQNVLDTTFALEISSL